MVRPMKNKKIKVEKFHSYTALYIFSLILGLIIGGFLNLQIREYLPMTNFFGEAGMKDVYGTPRPYNDGDIFRPFFGGIFWVVGTLVCLVVFNFFRKGFVYSFLYSLDIFPKNNLNNFRGWIVLLLGLPVFWTIVVMLVQGSVHLININFDTSFAKDNLFLMILSIWMFIFIFNWVQDKVSKFKKSSR